MSSLDTIRRFPYCQKVLPATYDDSLSYYQSICKLVTKMNEIITELNAIDPESILELVDDRVDERLVDLNKQMQNLTERVNQVMGSVTSALEKYNNEITMEMHRQLTEMTVLLSTQLAALRIYVNNQDNMILSELRYQIELLKNQLPELTTVYVYSPFSSQIVDIQTAINEIWDNIKVYSLTADEYDNMKWTAEQYDGFQLTAYQYDYYSRRFIWKDPNFYMTDVWTGEQIHTKEELDKLATLHKENALTTFQYDKLTFTAEDYESKTITATDFDWYSKAMLTYYLDAHNFNLNYMSPNGSLIVNYPYAKSIKGSAPFKTSGTAVSNIVTNTLYNSWLDVRKQTFIFACNRSNPSLQIGISYSDDTTKFASTTSKGFGIVEPPENEELTINTILVNTIYGGFASMANNLNILICQKR